MNALDIVLFIPLAYAAFKGFTKGFVYEIFSLLALGLGIYGCIEFSGFATEKLSQYIDKENQWLPLAAYTLTFIAIVVLVTLTGKILTKVISVIQLGLVNKISGALFGLIKAGFFLSAILILLNAVNNSLNLIDVDVLEGSLLYPPLSKLVLAIIPGSDENPVYQTLQDNLTGLFN